MTRERGTELVNNCCSQTSTPSENQAGPAWIVLVSAEGVHFCYSVVGASVVAVLTACPLHQAIESSYLDQQHLVQRPYRRICVCRSLPDMRCTLSTDTLTVADPDWEEAKTGIVTLSTISTHILELIVRSCTTYTGQGTTHL